MLKKLMLTAAMVVALTGQAIFAADFNKMIPAETDFIFQINVSKILAMPEVQKQITDALNKEPEQKKTYEELKTKSGFDPLKDIKNIVLFSSGKIIEGQEAVSGALIDGNFNIAKIVDIIKNDENAKKDVSVTVVDGFNCVVPKNSKEGYGMFLDNQFAVVGSQSGVNRVKEIKMGKGQALTTNKAFLSIANKANTNATLSGAGLLPQAFKDKCKQNPNAAPLANIDSFYFDFNNDKNMVFNLIAQVDKAENVNVVMTAVNGFTSMIKMVAGSQLPELADALNLITIVNEDTSIKIAFDIPAEKIAQIKAKLEEKAKEIQNPAGGVNAPRQ